MTLSRKHLVRCKGLLTAFAAAVLRDGRLSLLAVPALMAGCAHEPVTARVVIIPGGDITAVEECSPGDSGSELNLSAFALPVRTPRELEQKGERETKGTRIRRLTATFSPRIRRAANEVAWSKLTVRTYGGTIEGWTRVRSDGALIETAADSSTNRSARSSSRERAAVDFGPGYLSVSRSASSSKPVSSALSVDLLLLPGGVPIDEPLVRIPVLWKSGSPIAPENIAVQLDQVRHVPGYDLIEAEVALDYVLAPIGSNGACRGSTRTRVVLVDRDAVRPALWDVGPADPNGPRSKWLALSSPSNGIFRAVFDSPAAASSLANWLRTTRSTNVGPYEIGLIAQEGREPIRPLAPVDRTASRTFRPLLPAEFDKLRAGPLGEP